MDEDDNASEVTTIDGIFPGNIGRMQMVRVMLRFGMPELNKLERHEILQPDFVQKLLRCKKEVIRG